MDLICAAEHLDLHVGYWLPKTNSIAINMLLNEGHHLLPAFLGTVNKGLGNIFRKNYSSSNVEKHIRIEIKRICHQA